MEEVLRSILLGRFATVICKYNLSVLYIKPIFTGAPYLYHHLNFIFNGIGVLLMLPKIESIQLKNEKLRKFFVHTSIISYSMYLLQMTIILNIAILIFMAVASVNLFSVAVFLVLYVLAVYYISHLNYKHIELPFLKLRDKILDKYFSKKAE